MTDPLARFAEWQEEAAAAGVTLPEAMTLATADEAGRPSARTVLLKSVDERGFVFFTNYESRKGRQLAANPHAALTFLWHTEPRRQVLVTGMVEKVPRAESEAYFATRDPGSRLGAWASRQSSPLESKAELDAAFAEAEARFGDDVPLPGLVGRLRAPRRDDRVLGEPPEPAARAHPLHARRGWLLERRPALPLAHEVARGRGRAPCRRRRGSSRS